MMYHKAFERLDATVSHLWVTQLCSSFARSIVTMGDCSECSEEFPQLEEEICGRCRQLNATQNDQAKEDILKKAQCASCGLTWTRLFGPLCNKCMRIYQAESDLPEKLSRIPGLKDALRVNSEADTENNRTNTAAGLLASAVLHRADEYRRQASDSRLAPRRPQNRNLVACTTASSRVAGASSRVLQDRKEKKAQWNMDVNQKDIGLVASLWKTPVPRGQGKRPPMERVHDIRVQAMFCPTHELKAAIDSLILNIQKHHKASEPAAKPLNRGNLRFMGHQSEKKAVIIDASDTLSGTVRSFLHKVESEHWSDAAQLKSRFIEIRFVYTEDHVFPIEVPESDDEEYEDTVQRSSSERMPPPSTKRAKLSQASQRSLPSSRSVANTSHKSLRSHTSRRLPTTTPHSASVQSGMAALGSGHPAATRIMSVVQPRSAPPNNILRSRWAPRTSYLMNLPLQSIKFTRFTISVAEDYKTVSVVKSPVVEEIQVASDWRTGWKYANDKKLPEALKCGYLGKGYTKRAIYARLGSKEYALMIGQDNPESHDYLKTSLVKELILLKRGTLLKQEFDEYAKTKQVDNIPHFYFNSEDAFIGEVGDNVCKRAGDPDMFLPYKYFCYGMSALDYRAKNQQHKTCLLITDEVLTNEVTRLSASSVR